MFLRKIFGPTREEVIGDKSRLCNEEIYNLCQILLVIKSRRTRWVRNVARMEEEKNLYKILVGKPEGKKQLGRPRHRWCDKITMALNRNG
jgi:hypothetical protein